MLFIHFGTFYVYFTLIAKKENTGDKNLWIFNDKTQCFSSKSEWLFVRGCAGLREENVSAILFYAKQFQEYGVILCSLSIWYIPLEWKAITMTF